MKENMAIKQMIFSEFFNIELLIGYLLKYKKDKAVSKLLADRLKKYPTQEVFKYIDEIVFFTLQHRSKEIDIFLLDLCAESFCNYMQITTAIDVWGQQFMQMNLQEKKRIRNMLEDCETSMVNGEKCLINYSDYSKTNNSKENANFDQKSLYQFVIGKRSKNNFKDDVQDFVNQLIKLGKFLLVNKQMLNLLEAAKKEIRKINLKLHQRRREHPETIAQYRYMYKGYVLPFDKKSESDLIVRIDYSKTLLFQTERRCPYLIYFETVDKKELEEKEPDWEKDVDYLKLEFNLLEDKQQQKQEQLTELPHKKEQVIEFFKTQQNFLDNAMDIFKNARKNLKVSQKRSNSAPNLKKRKRKKKSKGLVMEQAYQEKKLEKMSIQEVKKRMNFMLLLIRFSSSRGLNNMHLQHIQKLKSILNVLERKKMQRKQLLNPNQEQVHLVAKKLSPFGKFDSYVNRGYIAKYGDDLRQEKLINHFIGTINKIFKRETDQIYLKDLNFIQLSQDFGLFEFVENSVSISKLKKIYSGKNMNEIYRSKFGNNFEEAQKNFAESLAGYSFISYILQIKDRHNENILIDGEGHIVHIDFGWVFNKSPSKILENSPFKFTRDYLDILGGQESPTFYYFKILLFKAFDIFKKYSDEFWNLIELLKDTNLVCFQNFNLQSFKQRFRRFCLDKEREEIINNLINASLSDKYFGYYEQYQKYVNDIEMQLIFIYIIFITISNTCNFFADTKIMKKHEFLLVFEQKSSLKIYY